MTLTRLVPVGVVLLAAIGVGQESAASRLSSRPIEVVDQVANLVNAETVVMTGLEWLKRHQSPDGSWSCHGFAANCDPKRGAACKGGGSAACDAGVTGLALLAFLGGGYDSQRPSDYLETVRRGLKYLKSTQDAEGCFGPRVDPRHTYSHACATMAMCEAYGSSKQLPWRKSAEAAVAYILDCQNPGMAWRYGKRPGDNDTSVTGTMIMALTAAKDAGVHFDERAVNSVKDGLAFIDSLTDAETGRTGYIKKGERSVRPEGLGGRWPSEESEALTALATCTRIACYGREHPLTSAGVTLLCSKLPVWDEARGSIDMEYWYWGTVAMRQLGGADWERWKKNMEAAVIDHQIKSSCAHGSWDPKDPWGLEGGRVYSTAVMTLCLEVSYRYRTR